jgi:hypothetical protein
MTLEHARIVHDYVTKELSQKALAEANGCSASKIRAILLKAGVALRDKATQRRIDIERGRCDHSEALRRAWSHGRYNTEKYVRTRGTIWRGADHSGDKNAFFGRTHTPRVRALLAVHTRARCICGFGEYGPEWTEELRERIRERDGRQCVSCLTRDTTLQVHHVDGNKADSSDGNLVTVCAACHLAHHRGDRSVSVRIALYMCQRDEAVDVH